VGLTIAIGCALVFLAGCGGEVTAVPERATSDGGSDDAPFAVQGTGSGVADAQSDAALEAPSPDSAAAFTGPAACPAAGEQCEVDAVCRFQSLEACGPGAMCCLDMLCAADATAPIIQASDYDQSCAVDSDCVEVHGGNGCTCEVSCETSPAAINMGALPQYAADFAKFPHVFCNCLPPAPPCANEGFVGPHCVGGMCQFTSPCSE
jgi:hypothetical protein